MFVSLILEYVPLVLVALSMDGRTDGRLDGYISPNKALVAEGFLFPKQSFGCGGVLIWLQ